MTPQDLLKHGDTGTRWTPGGGAVLRIEIRGRVQGVGYRWAMVEQARRLGLRGWVRNRREGAVEALVAGPRDRVDDLLLWARQGPPAAAVDAVEVFPVAAPGDGLDGLAAFEQRPTV